MSLWLWIVSRVDAVGCGAARKKEASGLFLNFPEGTRHVFFRLNIYMRPQAERHLAVYYRRLQPDKPCVLVIDNVFVIPTEQRCEV